MTPIAAMKSSTLSSLSVLVVTFLKTSPAFFVPAGTAGAGAAPRFWAAVLYTIPNPAQRITAMAAVSVSRNESFMSFTSIKMQARPLMGRRIIRNSAKFWGRTSEFETPGLPGQEVVCAWRASLYRSAPAANETRSRREKDEERS